MKQRLQKVLAAAGIESRRHIEEMIRQGRVSVNGKVRIELPVMIDPEKDLVSIDDEPVDLKERQQHTGLVYILMYKPKDVYSTNLAQGAQIRAIDLLPPDFPARVFPVGQLEAESTGLLLLTNDGEMTNQLTHARYGVPKTYKAIVDGRVSESTIQTLQNGVWLADPDRGGFKTGRVHITVSKHLGEKTVLEITLKGGRNRMIRRMLAKMGHKLRELTRVRMGPLTLHGLSVGQFRQLTSREVKDLKALPGQLKKRAEERDAEKAEKVIAGPAVGKPAGKFTPGKFTGKKFGKPTGGKSARPAYGGKRPTRTADGRAITKRAPRPTGRPTGRPGARPSGRPNARPGRG